MEARGNITIQNCKTGCGILFCECIGNMSLVFIGIDENKTAPIYTTKVRTVG